MCRHTVQWCHDGSARLCPRGMGAHTHTRGALLPKSRRCFVAPSGADVLACHCLLFLLLAAALSWWVLL